MDFIQILLEGLRGGLGSMISISIILLPLMIIMEIAKDIKLLDKISKLLSPLTRAIGISDKSAFPLAVGMIIGLTYGAGVIIQAAKEGDLDKRSLVIISIFLACCHAVIEDTLIFVTLGANALMLLSIRIIVALILTIFISKRLIIDRSKLPMEEKEDTQGFDICCKHTR